MPGWWKQKYASPRGSYGPGVRAGKASSYELYRSERMDQLWHETTALLDAIDQEYTSILQELATTTNPARTTQLRAMASICVAHYREIVQRYRATKQHQQQIELVH